MNQSLGPLAYLMILFGALYWPYAYVTKKKKALDQKAYDELHRLLIAIFTIKPLENEPELYKEKDYGRLTPLLNTTLHLFQLSKGLQLLVDRQVHINLNIIFHPENCKNLNSLKENKQELLRYQELLSDGLELQKSIDDKLKTDQQILRTKKLYPDAFNKVKDQYDRLNNEYFKVQTKSAQLTICYLDYLMGVHDCYQIYDNQFCYNDDALEDVHANFMHKFRVIQEEEMPYKTLNDDLGSAMNELLNQIHSTLK